MQCSVCIRYGNTGYEVRGYKITWKYFFLKINIPKGNYIMLRIDVSASCQKCWFLAKIFLILYLRTWNSITGIAIVSICTHLVFAKAENSIKDFWRWLSSIHFVLFADFSYLLPSRFKSCFLLCRNIKCRWEKNKAPKTESYMNP